MIITQNCIIDGMHENAYHADPAPTPSASRSFLQTLTARTPMHARLEHPRLNPDFVASNERSFDLGSAAHDYLLGGGDNVMVLDFPDYRTKAAQQERDAVLALNRLPILAHKFASVKAMAEAARHQIVAHADHPGGLQNGKPEQSIFWEEDGLWFRTRPDWITEDGWLEDYKTTAVAGPDAWMAFHFFDMGYDLQAYMGLRGYQKATGRAAKGFRFWVQEIEPPYALYCVVPSDMTLETAQMKFFFGKRIFGICSKANKWPGYSSKTYIAEPGFKADKSYEQMKEINQQIDINEGDLFKIMMDWQAPLEGAR